MSTSSKALSRNFILTLGVGITFGFSFSYLLLMVVSWEKQGLFFEAACNMKVESQQLQTLEGSKQKAIAPFRVAGDPETAESLSEKVRVLCWVLTSPNNHNFRVKPIKETWGRRCTVLLFMSTVADPDIPIVALNVSEGRAHLWTKTREAFVYVYKNYFNEVDWFLKADDDTYIVLENLRHFLSSQNPDKPVYFGCRFKPFVKQGYMSGGPGYVLSKEALRRFVEDAIPDKHKCKTDDVSEEDVQMGFCLENVGVKAGDARDNKGFELFMPLGLDRHLVPHGEPEDSWYWKYIYYSPPEEKECCSEIAVSFHYIAPVMMYFLEYFIYQFYPYGVNKPPEGKDIFI